MFAGHTLAAIVDGGQALCWRLEKEPGSRDMVEVSVTPEGIHIMGDTIPGHDRNGVQATQSLSWWVSEAAPLYLACNFLTKQWVPANAERQFTRMVAAIRARKAEGADVGTALHDLADITKHSDGSSFDSLLSWEMTLGDVIETLVNDNILDTSDCYPNLIYEPGEVALLAAIHDRFRECFMKQYTLIEGRPHRKR